MAITTLTNGIKGVANISFLDVENDLLIVTDTVTGFNFDRGIEEQIIDSVSELAEMNTVTGYTMAQRPIINMVFPSKTPEAIGLSWGLKWESLATATTVYLVKKFLVTKNDYPALGAGFEGAGIAADEAGSIGAIVPDTGADNGFSEPLTQGTFATMDVATETNTFGVDADGALKFSNDVIGKNVGLRIPYQLTGIKVLTEQQFKKLELIATMPVIGLDNLVQLRFPDVEAVLDDASLDFTQEGQPAAYRAVNDGSLCVPFEMKALGLGRKCAA